VVEHRLAKARVAGSNPVSRSNIQSSSQDAFLSPDTMEGNHYPLPRSECFPPQVGQTADMIDVPLHRSKRLFVLGMALLRTTLRS
jgi:hypothetical protein